MARILICGSRTWDNTALMERELRFLSPKDVVVHGAARGADSLAAHVAERRGCLIEAHPANWGRYGSAAGYKRNLEMLDSGVDYVIAFWDRKSRGTRHTITEARARNQRVRVVVPDGSFYEFVGEDLVDSTVLQRMRGGSG